MLLCSVKHKLYSSFNISDSWGWLGNATLRPPYPRERDPVPTVQEAGWVPSPVWTGAESLTSTGIQSPDRPARSHSLCRLLSCGPSYFWARLLIRMEGMRNVWEVFIRCMPKQIRRTWDSHSVNGWVWRYVGGLQLKQYAGQIYGTSISAMTAVFCARFGILAPALLKIRVCSDVTFRKIVLPLSSMSSSQRKVVALRDGACYTDRETATSSSVTIMNRM